MLKVAKFDQSLDEAAKVAAGYEKMVDGDKKKFDAELKAKQEKRKKRDDDEK